MVFGKLFGKLGGSKEPLTPEEADRAEAHWQDSEYEAAMALFQRAAEHGDDHALLRVYFDCGF